MHTETWGAIPADLPVTEAGTRRFIERWAPFSNSVNVAVPLQTFAAMELSATLGISDGETL